MIVQHRAFFVALGFTRTFGCPVEAVFSRTDNKRFAFSIRIENGYLFAFDPTLKTPIEGRLPLLKYTVSQRVIAFKGQSHQFQGFDHSNAEHFRVKIDGNVAEFFDHGANRTFYFDPVGAFALPATDVEPVPQE